MAKREVQRDLTIITTHDPVSEQSRLVYVWNAVDGETALDPGTREDVLVTAGALFTGTAADDHSDRLYVADVRRFEVLRLDDLDGDGVPETLAPGLAASYPMYAGNTGTGATCMGIEYLRRPGQQGLMPFFDTEPRYPRSDDQTYHGRAFWEDQDDDGVMELETTYRARGLDRIDERDLFAGNVEVHLDAEVGTAREIWALDGQGAPSELLASVSVTDRPALVTLIRPLAGGEKVGVRPPTGSTLWSGTVAAAAAPAIEGISPDALVLGHETVLSIRGARFASDASVRLMKGSSVVATLSTTWVSQGELEVQIPVLDDASLVGAGLHLEVQNPLSVDARQYPVTVRHP